MREITRVNFYQIKRVMEEGEIYQEGKNKYRASVQIREKIIFVLFASYEDYNVVITTGITTKK